MKCICLFLLWMCLESVQRLYLQGEMMCGDEAFSFIYISMKSCCSVQRCDVHMITTLYSKLKAER